MTAPESAFSESPQQRLAVLLVAAGSGSRLGGDVPKQFQEFAGQALFLHSLHTLQGTGLARRTVVLVPAGWEARVEALIAAAGLEADVVVPGGETRQQSVRQGLAVLEAQDWGITHVLVHDAARPFVSAAMVRAVVAAVHESGAATLAVPVSDTLMRAHPRDDSQASTSESMPPSQASELVDRSGMWAIQTPQVFALPLLVEAHAKGDKDKAATDDGSLVLALPHRLHFEPGAWWNLKVTHPEDFEKARLIAAMRRLPSMRFPDDSAHEGSDA